jgi:membrane-bound metal-dependent hydrolase YbcI (DUF457 family)
VPSPIGHALGAVAAGWAVARPAASRPDLVVQVGILAALGGVADLDLVVGRHSRETHSLGAAAIVASIAAFLRWPIASTRTRIWLAAFCAWMTHPLLDALSFDTSTPQGVMVWWPLTTAHWQTGWALFSSIYRNWREAGFLAHNLLAILREVLILAPVTALVWTLRRRHHQ